MDDDKKPAAKIDSKASSPDKNIPTDTAVDLAEDGQVKTSDNSAKDNDDDDDGDGDDDDDDDDGEFDCDDSLSDASEHAWDSDTLAAVAKTTHHQMIKRQPILIGCNRDGSINVQLPNGNIIVAERSAFPKFDKTGPQEKRRQAQRIKKDQFAYLARKEKAYTDQIPRTWEIEHFLNLNASSVFHVFDRRVNLDLFHPFCSNYELLRAWAQDDPYRYTPPSVDLPIDRNDRPEKPVKLKRKTTWKPHFDSVAKTLREQTVAPSIEDLRNSLIQRGKHRRLIYTQHLHTSDEAVIHQMIDDGMFQKPPPDRV